jgi:endogenous inhibitor of DNA gyrase (YacG/DUF329 family)
MKCEFCGVEITEKWGKGRFCSRKCANSFSSSKRTAESIKITKQKLAETNKQKRLLKEAKNNKIKRFCKNCNKEYYGSWSKWVQSEFCCKECARSYSTKTKRKETSEKIRNKLKGRRYIIKDKKQVQIKVELVPCPICGKMLTEEQVRKKRKTCSKECGQKLGTQKNIANGLYHRNGGFRPGSVRSRYGYYKGIYCASTYELVYLIYSLEHNIAIERNTDYFEYELNGEVKRYLPDFKIGNKYIEIKNYNREDVEAKTSALRAIGKDIEVLYYDELEYMMCYIDKKYGTFHKRKDNNYQTLYDDYKPKYTFICEHCGKETTRDHKSGKMRFCSSKCASSHGHSANVDVIDKEEVLKTAVPVPGYNGFWYSKDGSLYSSNVKRKDGKWLKCRLNTSKSGREEYKIKSKRFSIQMLNTLCNF